MELSKLKRLKGPFLVLLGALTIFELGHHSVRIFLHYVFSDLDIETVGTIVDSEILSVGRSSGEVHRVRYSYAVNGQLYESTMVNYLSRATDARNIVQSYEPNQAVTVYYDSERPYLSILRKTKLGIEIYIHLAVSFLLFGVSLLWKLYGPGRNMDP